MMGMTPLADAGRAADYFGTSDGGYYLDGRGLRREWGGKAAERLELTGTPDFEQFNRLLHGLDAHTGKQLTALLTEDRLAGWDFTASLPKGATTALEGGDSRIQQALYEAGDETMADIERFAATRVRKGGVDADRVTGEMAWLVVEHPETRPAKEDGMPDWDRHLHYVVPNITWDDSEGRWKALKVHDMFEMRKFFSHSFDARMSAKLAALGYEIETKYQADGQGGRKYHTWDIKAAPEYEQEWKSVNDKNSRRHQEIDEAEAAILAAMKARDANAPDQLSAVTRDKLATTTRRAKRADADLTLDGLRSYWQSRLMPEEKTAIAATIDRAMRGVNPTPKPKAAEAMAYAIEHHFERSSVVDFSDLAVTAMERSMGAALPEDFAAEAKRQGVLFDGGKATPRAEVSTQAVLDQERRIIDFARAGKGMFRPLAPGKADGLEGLSPEQQAAVKHVWQSSDQLMLIRGGAGTGKTTMMTPALSRLGAPVVLLAPSSDASRGQLRKEGFAEANTVAAFLGQKTMQEKARGGIIWVDEAGLLPINDLDGLCSLAKSLDARIVLQGDPSQHKAVSRHGNMLNVLERYAGLKVAKLTTIQRQKGDYAGAVAAIRDGDMAKGDGILRGLGWVVEGSGQEALVAEYAKAIEERKANGERKTVLVVDPTHQSGDALTQKLRAVGKAKGLIGQEEKTFSRLVPLNWTNAEKSDAQRYGGGETIQFFRNSGTFRAGDRVTASELVPLLARIKPEHFAVYRQQEINLAEGDAVRITSNGRDVTGKHRIDNGRIDRIRAFTPGGDMVLSNGWVIGKEFGHLKHGLVHTSHSTQSKTDDIVLASMPRASLGAMGAEQAYVTVSRGRERGMIFTDLARGELLQAISRADHRKSATELFHAPPERHAAADRMRAFMEKVRQTYRQLQRKAAVIVRDNIRQRGMGYAR